MDKQEMPKHALSIREWRDWYGENLQRFATRLDISMTTLQYWERGTKSPRQRMRQRIAERLGVPLEMIIWLEHDEKNLAA